MTGDVDEPEVRAVDGRTPGRRGRATRQRLLDKTEELLAATSYRDLRVVDIAREAGTSPATFYQYFAGVEEAVLQLGERVHTDAAAVAAIAAGDWSDPDTGLRLVQAFEAFWDQHGSVMRVVDLAAFEGDDRFGDLRTRALNAITAALHEALVRAGAGVGGDRRDPRAMAGVLVGMLAHVTAHREGFARWGVGREALDRAMADVLRGGLGA